MRAGDKKQMRRIRQLINRLIDQLVTELKSRSFPRLAFVPLAFSFQYIFLSLLVFNHQYLVKTKTKEHGSRIFWLLKYMYTH